MRIHGTAVVPTLITVAIVLTGCGGDSETTNPPDDARQEAEASDPIKRPHGETVDCSSRSVADFPEAFTDENNLVVGPLALIGAGGMPEYSESFGGNKFPLLVRNHHRVTIELLVFPGQGVSLVYAPDPDPGGHQVLTFKACQRDHSFGSSADGRPVTFWSGGVLADSPQCVPLRVWIDDRRVPQEVTISLGVECV